MSFTQWLDQLDPRIFWPGFVALVYVIARALFAVLALMPERAQRGPFEHAARQGRGRRQMATDLNGPVRRHNMGSVSPPVLHMLAGIALDALGLYAGAHGHTAVGVGLVSAGCFLWGVGCGDAWQRTGPAVPPEQLSPFWRRVYPIGMSATQLWAELHDFEVMLTEVPKVYAVVTGGRISNPNTSAAAVVSAHDEHVDQLVAEGIVDAAELAEVTP